MKSVAKEHPKSNVRVVDLDPKTTPDDLAKYLFSEIVAADKHVEVGYVDGVRHTPALEKIAFSASRTEDKPELELNASSVILMTGGARGITGKIAEEMARRYQCQLELVGRTQLTGDEDDELQQATDMKELRKLIMQRQSNGKSVAPAQVEKQCRDIMAQREVRATITAIESVGGRVNYHAVDVSQGSGLADLIDSIIDKYDCIDGVIHGSGQIEDKLATQKTEESFAKVFSTKVNSAHTLAEKLAAHARFMVFFSSVSSTFGNRGQTDYAAANDVLDKLAHWLHSNTPVRALSINWGPWRGVGMVQPELEKEYQKRGINLISPNDGVSHFFDELLNGSVPQAVVTANGGNLTKDYAPNASVAEVAEEESAV